MNTRFENYSDEIKLNRRETGFGLSIPQRYDSEVSLTDLVGSYDWQLTWKFSSKIRPNQFLWIYGASGMTYRRLYEILCNKFNEGVSFIDTYFQEVYPESYVKDIADTLTEQVRQRAIQSALNYLNDTKRLYKKDGEMTAKSKVSLRKIGRIADIETEEKGEYLARLIKEDIKNAFQTGRVPLLHSNKASTQNRRIRAGLPPDFEFYASGQLIDDLEIYLSLRRKEWQIIPNISV